MRKRGYTAIACVIGVNWLAPSSWAASPVEKRPVIEEIVVTAQRREETSQRAALPLTVLSGELIRASAISRPAELTHLVPALQVAANTAPFNVFYLRGVGNFTGNSLADPAVAFNVNDVYIGRPSSTSGFFYDLDRIEVLKGPQGILYGRNATGGAINVIPRRPQLELLEGNLSVEAGNFDSLRLDAAVNVPISTSTALRAAATRVRHDGYMDDGMDDQDDWAIRMLLYAQPRPDVDVEFVADYYSQGGRGPGSTPIALGPDQRLSVSSPAGGQYYENQRVTIAGRNFNALPATQQLDNEFWGLSAKLDWQMGTGVLTLIPAWRESRLDVIGTATGMTLTNVEDDEQGSLELRFASDAAKPWSYLLGAYYYDEHNVSRPFVVNNQYNISIQHPSSDTRSTAVFGNLTWSMTETLRGTVGARYTDDNKDFSGTFESFLKLCLPIPTAQCPGAERFPADLLTPPYSFPPGMTELTQPNADGTLARGFLITADEDKSFSQTTWRIGVDWNPAEQHLLYASVETGFKSGGFFFSNDSQVYDPEEITAITLGSKSRMLGRRLQVNTELFHWRYDDQQISTVTVDSRGATNLRTQNVGQATIRGAEVDLRWLVATNWLLGLDVQYLDAVYDSFEYTAPAGAPPLTGCNITGNLPSGYVIDCSGKRAPYAPEWTTNLSVDYTMSLRGGSRLVASALAHYQTEMLTGQDFTPGEYQPAYWWIDGSASYWFRNDTYELTAYAKNLTDEAVVANTFQPPFGQFVVGTLRPPRTFGLRLGVNF